MSKYKYITEQNIKTTQGQTVKHIHTKEEYTVAKIERCFITLYNKHNIPELVTRAILKKQFVVEEAE